MAPMALKKASAPKKTHARDETLKLFVFKIFYLVRLTCYNRPFFFSFKCSVVNISLKKVKNVNSRK